MRRITTYMALALTLCACTRESRPSTLAPGGEKTPLEMSLLLQGGTPSASTKAVDMAFENGDTFVAYLRHVTWDGTDEGERTSVTADHAPRLVTFTKRNNTMSAYDGGDITPIGTNTALGLTSSNTQWANEISPDVNLYWDDFSDSSSGEKDLRTEGHYLESFYGYCYNGGTASPALNNGTGVLGWSVATNQSTSGFKAYDILWSAEQRPVRYSHAAGRPGLVLPFSHAMSKVTIVLECGNGFDSSESDNFGSSVVTLKGMNTVATLTAPEQKISGIGTPKDIVMLRHSSAAKRSSYSALIAPSLIKAGEVFATINGIDGNNYTLSLTDDAIDAKEGEPAVTKSNAWSKQLVAYDSETIEPKDPAAYTTVNGGITRPGVHYLITVRISKQELTVSATISNWENVTAEGVGEIQFTGDVTEKGSIATALQTKGFAVYQSGVTDAVPATPSGYAQTSVWSYTGEPAAWSADPSSYWPNGVDKFYFRALSGYNTDSGKGLAMNNGRDVLWGTAGDPIAPRTGDVPLKFEHAMSKITINLVDANASADVPDGVEEDDYTNPLNPLLNLAGAKIQISNLKTSGTIDIHTGTVSPTGDAGNVFSGNYYAANDADATIPQVENYVVTPQTIPADSKLVVTLADGTTYSIVLNTCADGEDNAITAWERGKHYTYTITLSKEEITFRAMIRDWVETTGGGNANLEWD